MSKPYYPARIPCLLLLLFCISCISCVDVKKSVYFAGQGDASLPDNVPVPETVIDNHDLLSISVSSLNAQASAVFNAPNISYASSTSFATGSALQSSGYLVDEQGNIQFPILGDIKAAGLTENQLRTYIVKDLTDKKLLLDPIVSVRQLNFKVTILGEVGHPSVVNVPTEKITLLEALGLAGDITVYGEKDDVMVIREEAGHRTIKRLNLNNSDIFNSPYYYLKSNDIVYVEANKAKVSGSGRSAQVVPIVLSALSQSLCRGETLWLLDHRELPGSLWYVCLQWHPVQS
jgi:polysaccharide export outer membrane protein